MFIMFLPVAPIIIGICILVLALCGKVASVTGTLTTILWIILIAVSIITIVCNLKRQTSSGDKFLSTVITLGANILSLVVSNNYFSGLNASSMKSGLSASLDFAFTLLFGGIIWFGVISACTGACAIILDEYEDNRCLKALGSIVTGLVLAGIFNLI